MTRLWDKGAPLDERVLVYTAGEDHALDERLVSYDARASIAHAQMLHDQGLLSSADCEAIESGLEALAAALRAALDALRFHGEVEVVEAPQVELRATLDTPHGPVEL